MHYTKRNQQVLIIPVLFILFVILLVAGCKKSDNFRSTNSETDVALSSAKAGINPSRDLDLQMIASNFTSPIALVEPPDGSHRLFVVDQVGKIWIIGANGQTMPQPFIDVSSKMVT